MRQAGVILRVGMRVLLALSGTALAVALSPRGCSVARGQGAPVRASKVLPMQHPTPAPVVLPVLQGRGVSPWRLLQVRRVVDGDTYEVQALVGGLARVRLVGVDAPEHDQPYGAQVLDSLTRLLRLRFVWVRVTGVDQYGRNLGVVRLRPAAFSSGRAVALDSLLVVRGWAWAHAPAGQAVTRVAQQLQAQVAGRGLWKCRQARVVRPGIWRVYTKQEKLLHWVGCAW